MNLRYKDSPLIKFVKVVNINTLYKVHPHIRAQLEVIWCLVGCRNCGKLNETFVCNDLNIMNFGQSGSVSTFLKHL